MSRIGRLPIVVPPGVEVAIEGSHVSVKGPKGSLERTFSPIVNIALDAGRLVVTRPNDSPTSRTLHGTTRAVLNNMVTGVSAGFTRVLEIEGVGYRAEMTGANLTLYLGYSHPVVVEPPAGIAFDVKVKERQVFVTGFDKELVGQICANIREIRPPEPYKGKGVHYLGEKIRRKAGKSGKTAKGKK